jgi:CBS domain-containing protein
MPQTVNEVMTADPRTVAPEDSLVDAARHMREGDVGAVVVVQEGRASGIVTDRDIVVRAIADGRDPNTTRVADVASEATVTVTHDQQVTEAARLMREHDIRRLVVVQDGRPAGIVSIGDLAVALDDESALADISAASPNR